jgi:NAD(P)H-dependent flavin oxidoreductase YrpB (nitropropane dioxygenase family)
LAAALALGADAAVLGTRLLATTESNAHELYKRKILAASEEDTVHTSLFGNGWPNAPHRTLRTPFVEKWLEDEKRKVALITGGNRGIVAATFGGYSASKRRRGEHAAKLDDPSP